MPSELDRLTRNQKRNLLNKLYDLGAHTIWRPTDIVDWFVEIGVDCRLDEDSNTVVFLGERVEFMMGEWGEPGIYAPHLLTVLVRNSGLSIEKTFTGRGFTHTAHLIKLSKHWNIDVPFGG